jgi:hypothetical protein
MYAPRVFKVYTSSGVVVLMAAHQTHAHQTVKELFPDDHIRMVIHDTDWEDHQ